MKLMKSVAIGNSDERTRPRSTGILRQSGSDPVGPTGILPVVYLPRWHQPTRDPTLELHED